MRFLIDNNLSVKLTDAIARLGHDALQVRQVGLGSSSDSDLLSWAE